MKKILFTLLILFGVCLVSCDSAKETKVEEEITVDTLVVEADSLSTDSIAL